MGWIIRSIYDLVQNYGVAIILFTVVIKLLLLPLNIKSQRAMKKQQKIQPVIAELQKKYANDQAKLQQEMMKVYKENNVSMMGGCLPLLLQMPILIALYQAISRPLTYMFNIPYKNIPEQTVSLITELKDAMVEAGYQLGTLGEMNVEQLMQQAQIQISNWANIIGGKFEEWAVNFNFLGLDLSKNPSIALNYLSDIGNNLSYVLLLIIPVLAVISSIAQSKISMHLSGQDKNKPVNEQAQATNNMMMWMMPVMTGFFTFTLPAGMGLYWIISGLVQIIQQLALNLYFEKKGEDFEIKVPEKKQYHGKKSKKR